ncbi:MAG: S1/P1 nuclease [Dokdonella sp.]
MKRHSTLFALSAGVALSAEAGAWGPEGHRIIAEIAQRNLPPSARDEALRLLAIEGTTSFAEIASWADIIRDQPSFAALAKVTRPMHYMRFTDSTCTYDPPRNCPGGSCIVGGVERFVAILGDRSRSDAARAEALRFVVHFVGDIHQPLHAGYRSDRGGFAYQIQYDGRGMSTHGVWDYEIIASRGLDWRDYAQVLNERDKPIDTDIGTPGQWAEQSCRITRDGNIYPDGHTVDTRYMVTMRPIVEKRLREASERLTVILNAALVAVE